MEILICFYEHLDDEDDMYNRLRQACCKDIRIFHRRGDGVGTEPTTPVPISRELMNKASDKINFINLEGEEWEEMDEQFHHGIFKYPELILVALKKGESLFTEMTVALGTGGVINPNSMLPNELTHARWLSAIPQYRFKKRKEARDDYDYEQQVKNAADNLIVDREMQPYLSQKKITEIELHKVHDYWNNIDGHNLYISTKVTDANTVSVKETGGPLSPAQTDELRGQAEAEWNALKPEEQKDWDSRSSGFFINDPAGLEKEKAKIQSRLNELRKTHDDALKQLAELEAKLHPKEDTHDPIADQQDYLLSTDPILIRYDMPERWLLEIEYNGHMWPGQIWIRAIEVLIAKVESFRMDVLEKIQDFGGRISERASVKFSQSIPNLMVITIDDREKIESATLGQLIKAHYIYILDHLIGENYSQEDYFTVMKQCFANWRVPHPLEATMNLTFKTPERDHPLFSEKDSFSNLFNDERNEALRVLKIACHQILERLNDMLAEAQEIHHQKGIMP